MMAASVAGIDYTGSAYVSGGSPVGSHENPYTTLSVQPPPPPPTSAADLANGYSVYSGAAVAASHLIAGASPSRPGDLDAHQARPPFPIDGCYLLRISSGSRSSLPEMFQN